MRWRGAPEIPLLFWGGLLNGVWEFLHSPLYTDHTRGLWYVIWTRLHCTVGDLMILLASFWISSLLSRTRFWMHTPKPLAVGVFFAIGLSYTTFSEWHNTTVARTWQYADAMPTVFGIGLSPILQWVVVPIILIVLLRRRHGAPERQS